MSDEQDVHEESQERRPRSLHDMLRKGMLILAIGFIAWTYVSRNFASPPSHTPPKVPTATRPATPTSISMPPVEAAHDEKPDATPPSANPPEMANIPNSACGLRLPAGLTPERISHLETQLEEQSKALDALKSQVSDLQTQKEQMQAVATASNHKLVLMTALGLLKDAIHSGEPFAPSLNQLYTSVTSDIPNHDSLIALLDSLKPYADSGVPTFDKLQRQFDTLLPRALIQRDDVPSWKKNLASLISIRKVGDQPGEDDEAILARAEQKLAAHDVSGAFKEVEMLSKPSAAAMRPWTNSVNMYLNSASALEALQLALSGAPNA